MTSDDGSITAFVTVLTVALLAVAGLVFDGGRLLAAHSQAMNEAEAAARAGAQAVDIGALRGGGGVVIDPADAHARSQEYLASIGREGTVEVTGDTVRVHLTFRQRLAILGAFGIPARTVEGHGQARAVAGVTGAETP